MQHQLRIIWAMALGLVLLAAPARGQTVGFGASPGRASYRPDSQWNNGPFYTTSHVNPYAPHATAYDSQYYSEPIAPPYDLAPHGRFSPYSPGAGTLYRYDQGFSPLSGYAGWYERTYNFKPTDDNIASARTDFFRSAPRSAYVAYLTPLQTTTPAPVPPPSASVRATEFKMVVPGKPDEPAPPPGAAPDAKPKRVAVYGTMLKVRR